MTKEMLNEENFSIEILDDLILHIKIHDFRELTKDDILSMQAWVRDQSDRVDYVNLIQFGNGSTTTREAREFASGSTVNSRPTSRTNASKADELPSSIMAKARCIDSRMSASVKSTSLRPA